MRSKTEDRQSFDAVVIGGTIVSSEGRRAGTIAIADGRIAALLPPEQPVEASEIIDATGRLVIPGAIDAHVHFRDPGLTHKESFVSGTRAAAAGGVTTVMVMPTDSPWTTTVREFEEKRALLVGRAQVDVALQAALAADLSTLHEIEGLIAAGAISFELFLGDVPAPFTLADNGNLEKTLAAITEAGGAIGVTSADDGIIASRMAEINESGRVDPGAFLFSRPPVSEALGVARACILAESTGARLHLRQVSTRAALSVLEGFRKRLDTITAETTPHNLLLTGEDAIPLGPWAKVAPPLRERADCEALWHALMTSVIDIVATDHAPHAREEKMLGENDIWKAPGGLPGAQTLLPLMLDSAAVGRMRYEDVVRVLCEAPARIFGLGARKGSIAVGFDADLVLIDPDREWTIRNEDQESLAGVTPFAGRKIRGYPEVALLRGMTIMRDGRPVGTPSGTLVAP